MMVAVVAVAAAIVGAMLAAAATMFLGRRTSMSDTAAELAAEDTRRARAREKDRAKEITAQRLAERAAAAERERVRVDRALDDCDLAEYLNGECDPDGPTADPSES